MGERNFILPPLGLSQSLGNSLDSRPSSRSSSTSNISWHPAPDKCAFQSISRNVNGRVTKLPPIHKGRRGPSRHRSHSRSSDYVTTPRGSRYRDPAGFVTRSAPEDCLKCMLRIPHKKCEGHRYIRVGGGYRHSYLYVLALLQELEFQRQQEEMRQARLAAIEEKGVRAIKTYIRTKSGRLIEKIIFMSEDDYQKFLQAQKDGLDPTEILNKYLSKDEQAGLEGFDKEEQKAIKTYIRTKSGRLIEKLIYVSKSDYEAMKRGDVDAKDLLKKYYKPKDGETIEGWGEAKMRTITTTIRTKSGRLITKTIQLSEEEYQKLMAGDKSVLDKFKGEGETVEGWEPVKPTGMKVIKTMVRTKSGRLVEKIIMMTEEEYKQFMESGGDPNFLKKFIKLNEGETIEDWEKASTVYSASDTEEARKAKPGERFVDKDGNVYEYVIDPITGKKFKKIVSKADDKKGKKGKTSKDIKDPVEKAKFNKGKRMEGSDSDYSYRSVYSAGGTRHVRRRRKRGDGTYSRSVSYHSSQDEEGEARRRRRRRQREHEGSAHSYFSVVSEGGTRHVRRKKKRADGTYSASESYHGSDDGKGGKGKKGKKGKGKGRAHGSDSEHSYFSEYSEGGTRTVKRKKRLRDKDGKIIGYGKEEVYSSGEEERKGKGKTKKGRGGSDSEHSYYSEVSAGGTRHVKKRKKKEVLEREAKERAEVRAREAKQKAEKEAKHRAQREAKQRAEEDERQAKRKAKNKAKGHGSDSEYSYFSEYSEGGTRKTVRKKKIRDAQGRVIGYGKKEEYDSDEEKKKKERKKRHDERKAAGKPKHGSDSEHSYYSEYSEGGTRYRKRRQRIRDKDGNIIGYGDPQAYSSSEESFVSVSDGKGGRMKIKKGKYKPVFSGSDCTTDSDIVAARMKNMTEDEKKAYLAERAARAAERDQKRREKYGDKYDEMMEKHQKQKKEIKAQKKYLAEKAKEFKEKKEKEEKERRRRDGNEADDESDAWTIGSDGKPKKKKKRRGSGDSDFSGKSVWSTDQYGNKVKKKVKKEGGKYYEYIYDEKGNLIGKKEIPEPDSDGDYFEIGEDGKIRLKKGKKKIDITKLTDDQLRALGIDPTLPKSEIKRLLMEKFGGDIDILDRGKKIGMKTLADYGSDVNTDDLANDSDFDVSTLRGIKRVNVKMRRGGQMLLDHLKNVIEGAKMKDDYARDIDEKGEIDFLTHYRLVDPAKVEMYGKAFVVEDEDFDYCLSFKEMKFSLDGVPSVQHLTKKQMEYVFSVLKINSASQITFKMFAVMTALCERITVMDPYCKHLIEISNLMDIERKMELYKAMFYCNNESDRDANFITSDSLRIELMAGGLSWKQQEYIMSRMQPNKYREISFLDYMAYIPLFMSMHDNICYNPLDMSDQKYQPPIRRLSIQRDMNPLGMPLQRDTQFIMKKKAHDILDGKVVDNSITDEEKKLYEKYNALPQLISSSKGGAGDKNAAEKKQEDDWSNNIFADDDDDEK